MSYIISGDNKLPWQNYKPFFHMNEGAMNSSQSVNMFPVFCKICGNNKIVKAHKSSSCNLKRHMINRHPSYMRDVEVIRKRCLSSSSSSGSQCQVKVESSSSTSVQQVSCDLLVSRFVTGALLPTRIVENRDFLDLVHGLQQSQVSSRAKVLDHATLVSNLVREAQEFRDKVKQVLKDVAYVATTIDVWHNQTMRNFIGMTAQWIAPDTLMRRSVLLACRHVSFTTPRTSLTNGATVPDNNIALLINNVNREFGIQDKVVLSTIDNGSNQIFMYPGTPRDNLSSLSAFTGFVPLKNIVSPYDLLHLPPSTPCVVNAIHAMGIYEARDAVSDPSFNFQMKTLLHKCKALWTVATLNSENTERCAQICGLSLPVPTSANWKVEFECFAVLLKVHETRPDALRECCVSLDVSVLDDVDLIFLREYCMVMKPLASALDVLIGPNALYMGVLLPTVHSLKRRLDALANPPPPHSNDNIIIYCRPLAEALLRGLEIRFNEKWFQRDLVLAAVLHPNFQLSWIKDPQLEQVAVTWLREEFVASHSSPSSDDASSNASSSTESHDLFDFVRPSSEFTTDEVDAFLAYPSRDLSCLHSLPTLKTLFIKYNTAVPSSAAADRVFGVHGALFSSPDHNLFTDSHYEELIICKLKNTFLL